nr:3'-5' exonuclease [uncultured Cellulosilyticum sp.]
MDAYVVVDIETTGGHPINNEIIEIGAVYVENGEVKESFNQLVRPNEQISDYIIGITGITNEMVVDAPPIEVVMPQFIEFCRDVPLIGHNINLFDYRMLKAKATLLNLPFEKKCVDTLIISRKMLQELPSRKLGDLCIYYGISLENAHRAYDDAHATYELFRNLERDFKFKEPKLFKPEVLKWEVPKYVPMTKRQKSYLEALCNRHQIILEEDTNKLSKSEASRLIDRIISQYGK